MILGTPPVSALTVFDPSNYAQNVLQAVRALQQINNQIQSLQHEILMLQNMARNLERMDYSSIYAIQNALGSIIFLMNRAEGIAFEIGHTEREWARRSEEHTSELQSLMRISYAVFCLKKNIKPL